MPFVPMPNKTFCSFFDLFGARKGASITLNWETTLKDLYVGGNKEIPFSRQTRLLFYFSFSPSFSVLFN